MIKTKRARHLLFLSVACLTFIALRRQVALLSKLAYDDDETAMVSAPPFLRQAAEFQHAARQQQTELLENSEANLSTDYHEGGSNRMHTMDFLETHFTSKQAVRLIGQDSCDLSQVYNITYRYPKQRLEVLRNSTSKIIVGVLSYEYQRRALVRDTWAYNRSNVLFVVAGNWTSELEQELLYYQDLLWIDRPEIYRGLTYKTQAFVTVVAKHLSVRWLFKTDDDSYIKLDMLEELLSQRKYQYSADYVGFCHREPGVNRDPTHKNYESRQVYPKEYYEDYANGVGYVISSRAARCMVEHIPTFRYLVNEDVATGALAAQCEVKCLHSTEFLGTDKTPAASMEGEITDNAIIRRHVKSELAFWQEHARCCSKSPRSISCQRVLPVWVDSRCLNSSCYDQLEEVEDPLDYEFPDWRWNNCLDDDDYSFDEMHNIQSLQSHHHQISFATDPWDESNVCYQLDKETPICSAYRPQHYEMMIHYPARFIQSVRRVLFVGGGDSMLLHEILKYPTIELVVGLELDQTITRYSFKNVGVQPHFDDDRVQWWYGDVVDSLNLLPDDYFSSFDLVVADVSETVLLSAFLEDLNVLQFVSLLIRPSGVFVANELLLDEFSQIFQYSLQIIYPGAPTVCHQRLVLGSDSVDFLHDKMWDHGIETLYMWTLSSIEDRYEHIHDYRHNTTARRLCYRSQKTEEELYKTWGEQSLGVLMILEIEAAHAPGLNNSAAILTSVTEELGQEGFGVLEKHEHTTGEMMPIMTVILQEGYVVLRTQPELKYVAVDICLWSSIERQDKAKKSLLDALQATDGAISSFRIITSGMHRSGRRNKWWLKGEVPREVSSPCLESSPQAHPNKVVLSEAFDDVMIREGFESFSFGDGGVVVAVLCGEQEGGCKTLDILESSQSVTKVVPLWACRNTERRPTSCEHELAAMLTKAVSIESKISVLCVDPRAPFEFGRTVYKLFEANKSRLLKDDFLVMAVQSGDGVLWRRNFLERFRTDVIVMDPDYRSELLLSDTRTGTTWELGVVRSFGDSFLRRLVEFESRIETKTGLATDIRIIKGGLIQQIDNVDLEIGSFYLPQAYDRRRPSDQWRSQMPLAYQIVMQLETSAENATSLSSVEDIQEAVESTLARMQSDEISSAILHVSTNVGDGSVVAAYWSGGNFLMSWDGGSRLTMNWFTIVEHFDLLAYFVEIFISQYPEGLIKSSVVDEFPRGTGRTVNFQADLAELKDPLWAGEESYSTENVSSEDQLTNITTVDSPIKSQRRLEFVHITKVGGTAIEEAAFKQESVVWGRNHYPGDDWRRDYNESFVVPRSIRVSYDGEPWHTPHHWKRPNPFEDAATFAVVRNPYTRYLSEYFCEFYPWNSSDNVRVDDPDAMNKWLQKFIIRNRYERQNGHMLPQHYFIYDETSSKQQVDHVLKYENSLPEKLKLLAHRYGLNLTLPSKSTSLSRNTTIKDLSDKTIRLINEYATKDFEMLNYTMVWSASEYTDTEGSTNRSKARVTPSILLSVPFYVYEDLGLPDELTLDGEPFVVEEIDPSQPQHTVSPLLSKHADDVYLARAALKHPMRTRNAEEAKLFFVPTPFNMIMDRLEFGGELCLGAICNTELVQHVDRALSASRWYRQNRGKDHIAVASHWRWYMTGFWTEHFGQWRPDHINRCNLVDFERQAQIWSAGNRVIFPSYYVGRPCPRSTEKPHDFAMVATLERNDTNFSFDDRVNICQWVQEEKRYSMPSCGPGEQCPAISKARFGFHVRGDTYGSNRLMDTILSGSIPIFTRPEQYDVLPDWIDWDKISYYADVSNRTIFLQELNWILRDKVGYEVRQKNIEINRDLFDYTTIVPFDTYMYMFQRKVWPKLSHANVSTIYNALVLP